MLLVVSKPGTLANAARRPLIRPAAAIAGTSGVKNQVAQRLLLIRNLLVYGTACNGVSEDRYGCVINLCDLCAAYHLELSAGNDDRDNALQMLYHVFLCKALIL